MDPDPPVAVLQNLPSNPTGNTSINVTVGGTRIVAYRSSLDGLLYGPETPIETPITASNLATGTHTLLVVGKNSARVWQEDVNATRFEWTVDQSYPNIDINRSGWFTTATDVTITASAQEASISWIRYLWDAGDPCTSDTEVSGGTATTPILTGSGGLHTLLACAESDVGHRSTASASMAVDTTPPTLPVADKAGWQPEGAVISITSSDAESGIRPLRFLWNVSDACASGSDIITDSIPIEVATSLSTLFTCAENHAGLTAEAQFDVAVDAVDPTITFDRAAGWYTSATDVTITGADGQSGLAWIKWTWDGTDPCTATSTAAVTAATAIPLGTGSLRTLDACAQDNVGRRETASINLAFDDTLPAVGADKLGWYTTAGETVTITGADAQSGVAWVAFAWDSDTACDATHQTNPHTTTIPTGTGSLHTLYMCAQNNAGQTGTANVQLGVDSTVPSVGANKSGWYTTAGETVTITGADAQSGIAWVAYAWDSDTACGATQRASPHTTAIPVGAGGLHTLYMCAQNNAGQTGTANVQVGVDSTVPSVAADKAGWYTTTGETVTITGVDAQSGIAWVAYAWDSDTACSQTHRTNPFSTGIPAGNSGNLHTLYMCSENNVGVQGKASVQLGTDASAPTNVTVSYVAGIWESMSITVTTSALDPESGVTGSIEYRAVDLDDSAILGTAGACPGLTSAAWSAAAMSGNTFTMPASGRCYQFRGVATNGPGLISTSAAGGTVFLDAEHFVKVVPHDHAFYNSTYFTCGLNARGQAFCWGSNEEIGGGSTTDQQRPIAVDVSGLPEIDRTFIDLSTGAEHVCAISARGKPYCWGFNGTYGELGIGVTGGLYRTPQAVVLTNVPDDDEVFAKISCGEWSTCALTAKGVAYCWGEGQWYELGHGSNAYKLIPEPVNIAGLDSDDKVFVDVEVGGNHACGVTGKGKGYCWGNGIAYKLGTGDYNDRASPTAVVVTSLIANDPTDAAWVRIRPGNAHTCGLTSKGRLYCWGSDEYGKIGQGSTNVLATLPTLVDLSILAADDREIADIAVGRYHSCGLTSRGTAFCWGRQYYGALGNGTSTDAGVFTPVLVLAGEVPNWDSAFISIEVGMYRTCAVTGRHRAYCWGYDYDGNLGNGPSSGDAAAPSKVDASSVPGQVKTMWRQAKGSSAAYGINPRGDLFAWGTSSVPALLNVSALPVTDRLFADVSAGNGHACALTARGTGYCWGTEAYGELGNGGAANETLATPTAVSMPTGVVFRQISAGDSHTCALSAGGLAWCWGTDGNGRLGNGSGTSADQTSPSAVDVSTLTGDGRGLRGIAAGSSHTCAVDGRGLAWCWGSDSSGQLGNGATTGDQASPSPVTLTNLPAADKSVRQLSTGNGHVCAHTAGGVAVCWGLDDHGELGNGGSGNQTVPGLVVTTNFPALDSAIVDIAASEDTSCALTGSGVAFCWGWEIFGALGNDTTANTNEQLPVGVVMTGLPSSDAALRRLAQGAMGTYHLTTSAGGQNWGWGTGSLGDGTGDNDTPSAMVYSGM